MRLLDKYLLKNFVFTFVLVFVIVMALLTVVQVVTELDDFSELGQKGFTSGEIVRLVMRVSLYRLPIVFYHFSPYITLMAALFAVVRLHKANELVPMKAAGIGAYRIFLPFLVWSIGVTGLAVLDQEVLIPHLAMDLRRVEEFSQGDIADLKPFPRHTDAYDNRWSARWFNKQVGQMQQVTFDSPLGPGGRIKLIAATATWRHDPVTNARWWRLSDVERFDYDERGRIVTRQGPQGRPLYSKHLDSVRVDWLPPGQGRSSPSRPLTDMIPADLVQLSRNSLEAELISFGEIRDRIEQGMGDVKGLKMHMYRRFTHPLANIVLLMFGLPLVVNRDRRGMAMGVMMAVSVCIVYEAMSIVCQSLDFGGFWTPELAALLPIMTFGAPAIYLFDNLER